MDIIKEKYQERTKLWEEMKKLNDKTLEEKRKFTAEETESYGKMETDFEALSDEIRDLEKAEKERLERKVRDEKRDQLMKATPKTPIEPDLTSGKQLNEPKNYRATPEYEDAYRSFLVNGVSGLSNTELRALQADSDITGGFLVASEKFVATLIKDLEDAVFVRQHAKVIKLPKAESIGFPELTTRIGDPEWTAEIKIGSEDSNMSFGKRRMIPHPLARYIKVSKELIRTSTINVVDEIKSGLAYEFSTVEENAFLNGTGANQPLGVMVASDSGITTDRDESTGNTTTAIKADNLINALYKLKAQYRKDARWAFHRDALKMIRKLKDGEGNYLWKIGIAGDKPNTILDHPYDESEYMPNTFTTGQYVGVLGNWKYYWIADAYDMEIQVLLEKWADTNQNGYIGRKKTDGAPVHENAFVRVQLG